MPEQPTASDEKSPHLTLSKRSLRPSFYHIEVKGKAKVIQGKSKVDKNLGRLHGIQQQNGIKPKATEQPDLEDR